MELFTWARLQWDRALAVLTFLAGTAFLVGGWIGVSATPFIAKQVPYVVSGGIGGLALLILGGVLWLSADMNDEWRVLDRLEQDALLQSAEDDELATLRNRVQALEALLQPAPEATVTRALNGGARKARSSA